MEGGGYGVQQGIREGREKTKNKRQTSIGHDEFLIAKQKAESEKKMNGGSLPRQGNREGYEGRGGLAMERKRLALGRAYTLLLMMRTKVALPAPAGQVIKLN